MSNHANDDFNKWWQNTVNSNFRVNPAKNSKRRLIMQERSCSAFWCFFSLTFSLLFGTSALAASVVPEGAAGVLDIDVQVEGHGSEKAAPGAGLESRSWSVSNKASYRIAVRAQTPGGTGSEASDGGAAAAGESDEEWERKWEAKTAACNGDEQCEMQVAMAQASDPHAVQQMQQMMGMAAMSAQSAASTGQTWSAESRTGPASILEKENAFGVISELGGTMDVLCTIESKNQMDKLPDDPYGLAPPILTVNGADSTYVLVLPLDDGFKVNRHCTNGVNEQIGEPLRLIGNFPVGEPSWSTSLTVRGTVNSDGNALSFDGSKVVKAKVFDTLGRTATVTIHWQFRSPAP